MSRAMQSEYMYWAKHQAPVRYPLSSSEVPHFRLDSLPIEIADLELDGASRYRYPPLREAIAVKEGVSPNRVVMADGTSMANMLALSALLSPGDEVVAETPAYEPMIAAASHCGATIRSFRRAAPDFALDPAAIEAAVTPRTRVILLTNLHNPTGNLAEEALLREIGAIAGRVGAHVMIDEVYLPAAIPAQHSAAHLGERFIATASLTKCYGLSGLRCGWIIASPELAERMWRLNELFGVAQAHSTERLSLLALEKLDQIAAASHGHLDRNRSLANAFFAGRDDLDCAPMTGGITAFPRLLDGDVDALNGLLRERYDTSIVPGHFFGAPEHFRLGVGQPTKLIEGGLERLGAALDSLR